MYLITDLIDLQVTSATVRQVAYEDQTLDAFLPEVEVDDIESRAEEFQIVQQTTPPRALDTPAIPVNKGGLTEVRYGLAAFAPEFTWTETDMIRERGLSQQRPDLAALFGATALELAAVVKNTMEVLRGTALMTGAITLANNGVFQTVDFGIPSGNKITTSVAWNHQTSGAYDADVISDLRTLYNQYIASAGGPPGRILTSNTVLQEMLANPKVINYAVGAAVQRTAISLQELNTLVLSPLGLPPITIYDRSLVDDLAGTTTRITPVGKFVLLPDGPVGETQYGLTEEALLLDREGVLTELAAPGLIAVTYEAVNPSRKTMVVSALALPIISPARKRQIVIATVQ